MNGAARPTFGGLKIGGRFGGLPHQAVQFFLEGFDFVVHDIDSRAKLPANASLLAFMPPILTKATPKSPIDVFQSPKAMQTLTCTWKAGWGAVFGWFFAADLPYNLFPSLHIALRTILAETYARHTRRPVEPRLARVVQPGRLFDRC